MTEETGLSAEEFAGWITPMVVLEMFPQVGRSVLQHSLAARLTNGLLRSAAETLILHRHEPQHFALISSELWQAWYCDGDPRLWAVGDTIIPLELPSGGITSGGNRLFDVRFDPAGIKRMGGRPVEAAPTAPGIPPGRHPGGAPVKAYWEPLLIEMSRQIFLGELKPKNKAELTRAMLEWLSLQGIEASEASVKLRSRQLFEALCEAG